LPIIDVAGRGAKGQKLTLIVDDQLHLEVEEPADLGLALFGTLCKDKLLVDTRIATDSNRGEVDEAQ
jgi:hypothetical protein